MKLLIACDDATDLQVLLDDLQRAGLGPSAHAVVLSVADLLPLPSGAATTSAPPAAVRHARERAEQAVAQARRTAEAVAARLRGVFPGWSVSAEAPADAPAWAIVRKSDEWAPDLIVLGAQDRSALGRLLLGSVSQSVLLHAGRSVRIARACAAAPDAPQRLLVGVDGSPGAHAAVARIASRTWRPGCQVRLVTALDATLASMLEGADEAEEQAKAAALVETCAASLRAAGLAVSTAVIEGAPKQVLVDDAESWQAHCLFVGARGLRAVERLLLGSTSAALAARARCSVEVVRA
jgi:nucleotide-binding universal stress UspA family protein